ncbi:MAG: FG-GAP-like repeat-containing protein [Bacteroidota bacterium]
MKKLYFLLLLLSFKVTGISQNLTEHLIESGQSYDVVNSHSADMDNDGDKDVFTIQQTNSISWYENLGSGNFAFQRLITTKAMGAKDINTGDFDGDGDLDLVSASATDNKIAWYENLGNGYFSNTLIIDNALLSAVDVEVADVDNDGKIDVIAAGQLADQIVWYKNLGNGQFAQKQLIDAFTRVVNIKVADIDNDGFKDILAFTGSGYAVKWWLNKTDGTYEYMGTVNNSSADTRATLLTDTDSDGDLDLIIANSTNLKLYKFDNDIQDFFLPSTVYNNNDVVTMASADIDNDGDQDFVYGEVSPDAYELSWLENDGTGSYTFRVIRNTREDINSVNTEDYNNDGIIDIVYASGGTNRVNFVKGLGSDAFAPFKTISSNVQDYLHGMSPVDLDSDGDLDVVSTNGSSYGDPNRLDEEKLAWYENLGDEGFSRQKIIALQDSLGSPGFFNTADYDNDGDQDIIALNSLSGYAQVMLNDGNETFVSLSTIGSSFFEEILSYDSGDIDNDGDIDVVASIKDFNLSFIAWYENLGDGTFYQMQELVSDRDYLGGDVTINLLDFDGDGKLDIYASLYYMNKVVWYKNLGSATFGSPTELNSDIDSPSSILFDVDNDSDLDIVTVSRFDHKIVWQRKTGSTYSAEILIDSNLLFPDGLQIGDFDGDGLKDLFINHNYEMLWYKNLSGGNFSAHMHVMPLYQGVAVNPLVDMNNDSKLDILVGEIFKAKISWFENVGSACVTKVIQLNDTICQGSSYAFNGENIFEAGTYVDTLLTSNLCDSVVILNLRVKTNGCVLATCNELYISEYIKGSSFNKAIEIYNPTNENIDLSTYSVNVYINGSTTPTNSITLSGIIYADSTFVIAHPTSAVGILNMADLQTSALNFNGNDAIALTKDITNIDVIGQIGFDPGSAWTDSGISTNGMTLIRKYTNTSGNISNSAYLPSLYFDALPLDDFTNLKMHSSECQLTLCNTDSTLMVRICQGDSYTFNGNSYSNTGVYFDTIPNASLCDSVVTLNLSVNSSLKYVDTYICSNETYLFNGQNLSTPGVYFDTLANIYGCDSVVKLTLRVYQSVNYTLNQTICFGESIVVNGTTYSSSITGAIETFPNAGSNGCDSIVTINLTVRPMITGVDVRHTCGPLTWINGVTYSTNNTTATHLLPNASHFGCDSLVTLNLTIHGATSGTHTVSACESYTWINGLTYSNDNNTATHTLVGANQYGCDSIVTLNLTINLINSSLDVVTACQSYTWMNGVTYTSNNSTASFTLPNATVTGCDSIIYLELTILPAAHGTDFRNECAPFTWINGVSYSTNNTTATFALDNAAASGCDSIVHLNLSIIPPANGNDVRSECAPFTWINGITYTANNSIATFTLDNTAASGCDSIVHLMLTIIPPSVSNDVQSACESFTWIDGNTYTASNSTAIFTIPNGAASGCDSIVHLNLTINSVNSTITNSNNTLSSTVNGATYHWIDCATNTPINGATNQSFTPTVNGSYAVIATKNECVDTSACMVINNVGQNELTSTSKIILYPNPTTESTTLNLNDFSNVSIEVLDLSGKIIFKSEKINTQLYSIPSLQFAKGVYMIHVFNEEINENFELVKL